MVVAGLAVEAVGDDLLTTGDAAAGVLPLGAGRHIDERVAHGLPRRDDPEVVMFPKLRCRRWVRPTPRCTIFP